MFQRSKPLWAFLIVYFRILSPGAHRPLQCPSPKGQVQTNTICYVSHTKLSDFSYSTKRSSPTKATTSISAPSFPRHRALPMWPAALRSGYQVPSSWLCRLSRIYLLIDKVALLVLNAANLLSTLSAIARATPSSCHAGAASRQDIIAWACKILNLHVPHFHM